MEPLTETNLKIRLFASLRELVGRSELYCFINHPLTVRDLLENVFPQLPEFEALVHYLVGTKGKQLSYVVDGKPVTDLSAMIRPGSELAILPPVGGG